jgi:hypothetical protein
MLKKEENIHGHERKKECMTKSKKKKEKKEIKMAYTFKAIVEKRVMIKGVQKIFRIRKIIKKPHNCTS